MPIRQAGETEPSVTFRVDSSAAVGSGHLMRCLTLAEAVTAAGGRCRFILRDLPGNGGYIVRQRGFELEMLPAPTSSAPPTSAGEDYAAWLGVPEAVDAADTIAALQGRRPHWLIVDHYALGLPWEQAVRPHVGRLAVIDDLADRPHSCDALLDQTFGRTVADYAPLVPPDCRIFTGTAYALLRDVFAAARPAALARRTGQLRRVLICMGSSDPEGATGAALDGLDRARLPVAVDVVLGAAAPHLLAIRSRVAARPDTRLHVDTDAMAHLMTEADLAIGAGGTTSWERCCLGLPTLAVTVADNQATIVAHLAEAGAVVDLGWLDAALPARVTGALGALANRPEGLLRLSEQAAAICDGRGAGRFAAALLQGSDAPP